MLYVTHVYQTGRMDIEMGEVPFSLKISFVGEDSSRWTSVKYTLTSMTGWKILGDSGSRILSAQSKIDNLREAIMVAPKLRYDKHKRAIIAVITDSIGVPMSLNVPIQKLGDIPEELESEILDPPDWPILNTRRCPEDIKMIRTLEQKIEKLAAENKFLKEIIFR